MLKDLSQDQLQLAELMSQISEAGYSAGWMKGLEFDLWDILIGSKSSYGRHIISQEELLQLKFLSDNVVVGSSSMMKLRKQPSALNLGEKDLVRRRGHKHRLCH